MAAFDNLERRCVKNKVVVCFKSTIDSYIGESINDATDFIKAAQKICRKLWIVFMDPLKKVANGSPNRFNFLLLSAC